MLSPSATAFSCFPTTSSPREEQHIRSHDNAYQKSQKFIKNCVFPHSLAHNFCSLSASYRITWRFPRLSTTQFYILYFLACTIQLILAEIAPKCCRPWNAIYPCEVTFYSISSLLTRYQCNIFILPVFCPSSALQMQLIFCPRLQSTRQISIYIYTHPYMYIQL